MSDAGEIAKALQPVTQILGNLLGPLSKEYGEILGDAVKSWRGNNVASVLEKTAKRITLEGEAVEPVAPRSLIPLLEAASLEDNQQLQEMWAGLLATASIKPGKFTSSYITTMKLLSPGDARVLAALYSRFQLKEGTFLPVVNEVMARSFDLPVAQLAWSYEAFERSGITKAQLELTANHSNPGVTRLLGSAPVYNPGDNPVEYTLDNLGQYVTRYGANFARACMGAQP